MADEPEVQIEFDDDALRADAYGIAISTPDNEMRIRFYDAEENVLSDFIVDAAGAYEFAQRILRSYDQLEGL